MKGRILRAFSLVALAGLLLFQSGASTGTARADDYSRLTKIQRRLLSGLADLEINPQSTTIMNNARQMAAAAVNTPQIDAEASRRLRNYFPSSDGGCPMTIGDNVKVNQNCLNLTDEDLQGRGQANNETSIAQDPNRPNHIVASDNDYIRGDGNCGVSYSLDNGENWSDSTVPNGFTRGTAFGQARQYWQGGGDTSVAWDTKGNVYLSCQLFNRGSPPTTNIDQSSTLVVLRSTQNNGASWNFPARPVSEANDLAGTGAPFEDKQLLTVDNHRGSPFQDRVYVTWTEFAASGSAYIWESYSADYGETFSPRVLVSKTSPLCVNVGAGTEEGNCNSNQFSQPFTGPDGALYVTWANFNNATGHPPGEDEGGDGGDGGDDAVGSAAVDPNDNHNQILLAKSTDGGVSFSDPVKVADYYDLPDCETYQGQNAGRSCVPEKGDSQKSYFRATNYPVGSVNPRNPRQVVVTFGSYINMHSKESNGCAPAGLSPDTGANLFTGVKTPGACNNDIVLSVSNNGGSSFTGTTRDVRRLTTVTQDNRQATTDQWFQWATFTNQGRLAVAYYDRQYGRDEFNGFSDYSLSGSDNLRDFATRRATSSSMPPPTEFAGVFWGDYAGLSAVNNNSAHPFWSDTRPLDVILCPGTGTPTSPPAVCTTSASNAERANDQDVFTTAMPVPSK